MMYFAMLLLAAVSSKDDFEKLWITQLKTGMTEVQVLGLLGEPYYIARGYPRTVYYYQPDIAVTRAAVRTVEPKSKDKPAATIEFVARSLYIGPTGNPNKTVYLLADRYTPDWDTFKPASPKTLFEPRSGVSPKTWEIEANWQKLQPRMNLKFVRQYLGAPDQIFILFGNVFWFYGDIQHFGFVRFYNNTLIEWNQPYWPDVNSRLFGDD